MVLYPLPHADPCLPHRAEAGQKSVYQGRFANARFAADKGQLTGASAGRRVPFLQSGELFLPANQGSGQLPVVRPQVLAPALRIRTENRWGSGEGGNEPIPLLPLGCDKLRGGLGVA